MLWKNLNHVIINKSSNKFLHKQFKLIFPVEHNKLKIGQNLSSLKFLYVGGTPRIGTIKTILYADGRSFCIG